MAISSVIVLILSRIPHRAPKRAPKLSSCDRFHRNNHPLGQASTVKARLRGIRFDGDYARVAKRLRLDPSYVSRVVDGTRNSDEIMKALEEEMKRLEKLKPK